MSSAAAPVNLVLVRLSADGTVEWIQLERAEQHVMVAADDAYTLIDRVNYEAPETLVVQRVGKDLVVDVHGNAALVLEGFFTTAHVEFYPTTNIAGGAGLFSGPALTADSMAVADYATGELVLWSTEPDGPVEPVAMGAGSTTIVTGAQAGGGGSPLLWTGLGVAGLGLAALAGGGGGSGGGESGGSGPPPSGGGGGGSTPPPTGGGGGSTPPDTTAPQITSGATASPIAENSGAGQVVYTATATDASTVSYSLSASGDANAFSINATTGAVTLSSNPDFEAKPSYTFTVVATDTAGNHSERTVSLAINNLDEVAPTITSGGAASPIEGNSGPAQVVYTVTSTDTGDISTGSTTYSLKATGDAAAFAINASTGAVTLIGNPDFDTKPSYSFTVVATDAAHNSSEKAVSLQVVEPDTTPPTLSVSTPADGARDVPVADNIVLVFSENVTIGSGTITIRDHGDNRMIDVTDSSQVTISGNQVTINPVADLNANGNYEVRVTAGAFTDLSGNPFAGLEGRDVIQFRTASSSNLLAASLDGRAFEADTSPQIDIRDTTSTAAADATLWSGPTNLGSDARVMLAGAGADVALPNPLSMVEPNVAWPLDTNVIIEGSATIHVSLEELVPGAHDAVATHLDLSHLPIATATSQGLV